MTLLELLARELEKWPEADCEQGSIESMSQAGDLQVSQYSGVRQVWREDVHDWSGHDYVPCSRFALPELATDHATAIVTRSDWEAEKARIAGKVDGGWKRHRGGKCPVEAGQAVTIRCRDGMILDFNRASNVMWEHKSSTNDVMAWKLYKPAEQSESTALLAVSMVAGQQISDQPAPVREPEYIGPFKMGSDGSGIEMDIHFPSGVIHVGGPLAWRDRIRALDTQRAELEATYQRQIGEIDGERGELVGKLAGEGLALVERTQQPVEDMSYPHNWKQGDVLLCEDSKSGHYTTGKLYKFICISPSGSARSIDDRGQENGLFPRFFKWHSRQAS